MHRTLLAMLLLRSSALRTTARAGRRGVARAARKTKEEDAAAAAPVINWYPGHIARAERELAAGARIRAAGGDGVDAVEGAGIVQIDLRPHRHRQHLLQIDANLFEYTALYRHRSILRNVSFGEHPHYTPNIVHKVLHQHID